MGRKKMTLPAVVPSIESITTGGRDVNVLDYIRNQAAYLEDAELSEYVQALVSGGMPIKQAAKMCGVSKDVVWRLLVRAPGGMGAFAAGRALRVASIRERVFNTMGSALDNMESVMNDTAQDGRTRLDAAEKLIGYAGVLQDQSKGGGRGGVNINFGNGGQRDEFAERLQTITLEEEG